MIPASRNEKMTQDSITSEEKIKIIIKYLVNRLEVLSGIYKNPFNSLKIKTLNNSINMQLDVASMLNNYWTELYKCKIDSIQRLDIFSDYIMLSKEIPEYILNSLVLDNNEAKEKLENASKVILILEEMNEAEFDRFKAKKEILGETADFEIKEEYLNNKKITTVRIITKLIELSLSDYTYNVEAETWSSISNMVYRDRPKCEVSIIRKDGIIIPNDKVQQILYKNTDKNKELVTSLSKMLLIYTNKILYIIENSKAKESISIDEIYKELLKGNISDEDLLKYIMSDELKQLKDLKDKDDEVSKAIKVSLNAAIERYEEVIMKGDVADVEL